MGLQVGRQAGGQAIRVIVCRANKIKVEEGTYICLKLPDLAAVKLQLPQQPIHLQQQRA